MTYQYLAALAFLAATSQSVMAQSSGAQGNNPYVVLPYGVGQPVSNEPVTTITGPNGATQTQVGNTTYYSPGGSSVTNGNKTIYSNGTNCTVQGNKKTCN